VINLSADKDRVLREAFRVLKPGGRFAVSDVVVRGSVRDEVRNSMLLWVGRIAGALEEDDYRAKLTKAGFGEASVEPTRVYNIEDARLFLTEAGVDVDAVAPQLNGKFMSAFIRAKGSLPAANLAAARRHYRRAGISACQSSTTRCSSAPAIQRARLLPKQF